MHFDNQSGTQQNDDKLYYITNELNKDEPKREVAQKGDD